MLEQVVRMSSRNRYWIGLRAVALKGFVPFALALLLASSPSVAHEFWLEPTNFTPKAGESIAVTHFVGENFKGESFPFVRDWYQRYVVANASSERDVDGVEGNDPALKLEIPEPGLAILAYQSHPNAITFEAWPKYEKYLKDEGLERFEALHRKQGKPETGINEFYTRYAKALISVAGGKGEDRAIGLPLEMVAERNPYELGPGEKLPVRLLLHGKPVGGVMIKAFNKTNPKKPLRVRTDAEGRAEIPLPVSGIYLLNAVHMMEPVGLQVKDRTFHWQSLWASLTFARP